MSSLSVLDILAEDPCGAGLGPVREEIMEMNLAVKRHMDTGLAPEEMPLAVKARAATQAAASILEKLPN